MIEISFYSTMAEKTGTPRLVLELPPHTSVYELLLRLWDSYPLLARSSQMAILINGESINSMNIKHTFLKSEDKVFILPNIFGG